MSVRNRRLRTAVTTTAAVAGSAGLLAGALYVVHAESGSGGREASLAGDAQAGRSPPRPGRPRPGRP